MDDEAFQGQLAAKRILPSGVKAHINFYLTRSDKVAYFLQHVIRPSVEVNETEEFNNLIATMEKSEYPLIQRLATKMKLNLEIEFKGNYFLLTYLPVCMK